MCPNCYVVLFALHFCSLSRCSQWARRCWCCWCEHLISRRSCEVHERSKGTWRRRRPWAWWRCRCRSQLTSLLYVTVYPCLLRSIVCVSSDTFASMSSRVTTISSTVFSVLFHVCILVTVLHKLKDFLAERHLVLTDKDTFRQGYIHHDSKTRIYSSWFQTPPSE